MSTIDMTRSEIIEELELGEEGFRIENPLTNRAVEVVNYPHERFQMSKGGMVSGLTNSVMVAYNFLVY